MYARTQVCFESYEIEPVEENRNRMCGIAGIVTTNPTGDVSAATIRMRDTLRHRGPDDEGVFSPPDAGVGLAHTRLSILDPSSAGHQPMTSADQRYWPTFNGEIYNFRELRDECVTAGETFVSDPDTEVLLCLLRRDGKGALSRLRGMFAFAFWDNAERRLLLAREPLGIKPLYYSHDETHMLFASEVRALLASGCVGRVLSPQGVYGYLRAGAVPEPHTFVSGVHMLEAGSCLEWHNGRVLHEHYWQPSWPASGDHARDGETSEDTANIRETLRDAIRAHLISDVPVGLFLSGGLDSTSILSLAREQMDAVNTFSVSVDDQGLDEGALAERAARHFGASHTTLKLNGEVARETLPAFFAALDQPSVDGFNTFCVAQMASAAGQKVILSGVGGELFGGYPSFREVRAMYTWQRRLRVVAAPLSSMMQAGRSYLSPKLRRIGDLFAGPPSMARCYASYRGVFAEEEALALTREFCGADPSEEPPPGALPSDPHDAVSHLETTRYLRNQLLRDSDVMSMASGLELRTPLVDQWVLSRLTAIPATRRMRGHKSLLTDAANSLPSWLLQQPKRGFTLPFAKWVDNGLLTQTGPINTPAWIGLSPWYRRWTVTVFDHWRQQHIG